MNTNSKTADQLAEELATQVALVATNPRSQTSILMERLAQAMSSGILYRDIALTWCKLYPGEPINNEIIDKAIASILTGNISSGKHSNVPVVARIIKRYIESYMGNPLALDLNTIPFQGQYYFSPQPHPEVIYTGAIIKDFPNC